MSVTNDSIASADDTMVSESSDTHTVAGEDLVALCRSWEGNDPHITDRIWPAFAAQVKITANCFEAMRDAASAHPVEFAEMLKRNGSPYTIDDPGGRCSELVSSECLVVLFFSVFEWMGEPLYNILCEPDPDDNSIPTKKHATSTRWKKHFEKLLWVVHCLLVYAPNEFPKTRHAFSLSGRDVKANTSGRLEFIDLVPTKPHMLSTILKGLPFSHPLSFFRCFGGNYRSQFMLFSQGKLLQRSGPLAVPKIIEVMKAVERCFAIKLSHGSFSTVEDADRLCLRYEDADRISHDIFGIHPSYWVFFKHSKIFLPHYNEHCDILKELWDNHQNCEREAAVVGYRKQVVSEISKKSNSSDSDTEVNDEYVNVEQRGRVVSHFLAKQSLAISSSSHKNKKKSSGTSAIFKANIRRQAMNWGSRLVLDKLVKNGQPVDMQLIAGRRMWKKFGTHGGPRHPSLRVNVNALGTGGTPSVALFTNAFSESFLRLDREITNETRFCKDTKSDGGTSSIAAFFHCKACLQNGEEEFSGPLMKIGAHNSVASVRSSEWEIFKMEMASEIANAVIDATNKILLLISKMLSVVTDEQVERQEKDTTGDKGRVTLDYGELEAAAQSLIKEYESCPSKQELNDLVEEDLRSFPRHCVNANICKVGSKAKYGRHQDSSFILNSPMDKEEKCVANDNSLPVRGDMLVVTFVTGLGECQAKLSWHRDEKELLEVVTTGNCIHFQMAGVQSDGIEHESNIVNKKAAVFSAAGTGNSIIRKIDTYRMALCPKCDSEAYQRGILLDNLGEDRRKSTEPWRDYHRVNVMQTITEIGTGDTLAPIADGPLEGNNKKAKLNHNTQYEEEIYLDRGPKNPSKELYAQLLGNELMDSCGKTIRMIVPMAKTVALPLKHRRHLLCHYDFVRKAVKHCLHFKFVNEKGEAVIDQPMFMRPCRNAELSFPLIPGDKFQFHELPIRHSKTQTCVVQADLPGVCVLVHAYKNDPKTCGNWRTFANSLQDSALDNTQKANLYNEAGHLTVHGFAGSMQKSDQAFPTARMLRGDSSFKTGFSQRSDNAENAIFTRNRELGRVTAVFMCESSWEGKIEGHCANDSHSITDSQEVLFLGYFVTAEQSIVTLTRDEVRTRFEDMASYYQKNRMNLNYMLHQFIQFKFKPIFTMDQILIQMCMVAKAKQGNPCGYQPKEVWNDDTRPLRTNYHGLMEALRLENAGLEPHISDVTESLVREQICKSLNCRQFIEEMQSPKDCHNKFQRPLDYANSLTVNDCAVTDMHVMAAAAMRYDVARSIINI